MSLGGLSAAREREEQAMAQRPANEEREQRLHDEIIVDAYGPEEQAGSWYSYLEDRLHFPFRASSRRCLWLSAGERLGEALGELQGGYTLVGIVRLGRVAG